MFEIQIQGNMTVLEKTGLNKRTYVSLKMDQQGVRWISFSCQHATPLQIFHGFLLELRKSRISNKVMGKCDVWSMEG